MLVIRVGENGLKKEWLASNDGLRQKWLVVAVCSGSQWWWATICLYGS